MSYDRGAVSTELAVLTPVLIGLMLFVVYAGRVVAAEADVAHAANEAARAATLTASPQAAHVAAAKTATANVAANAVSCVTLEVDVETSSFTPGGQVSVTLTCQATFADLSLLTVPGSRSFTATATSVIDVHRSTETRATP